VGRSAAGEAIFRAIRLSPWGGTADEVGLDGSRRLFGFQPMLDPSKGGIAHAAVGIPAGDALARADRILVENLAGLALVASLALIAAWVGGSGLFLRRVNALVLATRRLSAGDLSVRTPRAVGAGELEVLAGAFNEMASALEARTLETLRQSRALMDLERRFRALIENSSDGIFVVSGRRRVTYASPAIARILGYSVEEVLGRDLVALVRTADRPLVRGRFADVLRNPERTATVEVPVRHKDGSPRWVEAVIGNLLADPSVGGVVVNYRDITERRQAAEALRTANEALEKQVGVRTAELVRTNRELQAALAERERAAQALRKLSSAVEQTTDSVFIVNREGIIEYVNPAFERLTGFTREEAVGKSRRMLSSGEHSPRFYTHLWEVILAGEVFRGVFINRRRDGERYYEEETITPLRNAAGELTHFVCAGRDITRRQRTEEALRRLNDRMEKEAERIAQVFHDEAGQLLTSAHITLAEVGRGLSPAIQERLEKVRQVLDEVEEELRHLIHEIRPRILDDLGLGAALEFLIEGVAKRTGMRVRMKVAVEGPLPAMVETAIYRFVQEALTNAAKHARASEVTLLLERRSDRIHCTVRDDGIGFEVPQDLTRSGDAGLGLPGIQDRVEALGGTLEINSSPGQGAELVAAIPLEATNETANSVGGRPSTGPAGYPGYPGARGI
jgi:PAS domain S-box-containing protein